MPCGENYAMLIRERLRPYRPEAGYKLREMDTRFVFLYKKVKLYTWQTKCISKR